MGKLVVSCHWETRNRGKKSPFALARTGSLLGKGYDLARPVCDAGLMGAEEVFGGSVDGDSFDEISSLDGIHYFLSLCDFSKNGMLSVEVGSWEVSDEKLRTVGIRSGIGHRENTRPVVTAVGLAFTLELVAGVASASAERAAALNHEIWNDAVKGEAVVKSL